MFSWFLTFQCWILYYVCLPLLAYISYFENQEQLFCSLAGQDSDCFVIADANTFITIKWLKQAMFLWTSWKISVKELLFIHFMRLQRNNTIGPQVTKNVRKRALNTAYEKLDNVIWWAKRKKKHFRNQKFEREVQTKWVMNFLLLYRFDLSTLSWWRLYHIETIPLICGANQWTGFYIIMASIMK